MSGIYNLDGLPYGQQNISLPFPQFRAFNNNDLLGLGFDLTGTGNAGQAAGGAFGQGRAQYATGNGSLNGNDFPGTSPNATHSQSSTAHASRHQAAEQRRRTRINERLELLRRMVPHSERSNTAVFLEEVIMSTRRRQMCYPSSPESLGGCLSARPSATKIANPASPRTYLFR